MCAVGSCIVAMINMYFGIRCQRNFNKGLKPHVQWSPFKKKLGNLAKSKDSEMPLIDDMRYVPSSGPIDDDFIDVKIDKNGKPSIEHHQSN
ncbi:hypothetical protein DFQ30_000281 [Apophysomyces sp. BC1015]|nr:hypothetical protein DFQ30_000281 [Apophysomyces sp. BC1015]